MRRFLKGMAALAAVVSLAILPTFATTGSFDIPDNAIPVGGIVVAADVSPALIIKYNGTGSYPEIANATGASITFEVGDVAYTGFECPVSGALGGIIDTSNAACNTFGEVVDTINSASSDFVAVIASGLRSDASASLLTDAEDSDVATPAGEYIYWDTSVDDDVDLVLTSQWRTQIQYGLDVFGEGTQPERVRRPSSPWQGYDTVLLYAAENLTNAGNITNFDVLCVVEDYIAGSEVATVIYREAGAATTVQGTIDEFKDNGGLRCRDGKIVVRIYADSADSSVVLLHAYGYRFKY